MSSSRIPPQLSTAALEQDVYTLVKGIWGWKLLPSQEEIVRRIAYSKNPRICINAHTRYGKTRSVAFGILLYIMFNKNKKVALIGPTNDQAKILRDYLSELVVESPIMRELAHLTSSGYERLLKEASKKRQTFKNACEYRIFSANNGAKGIMGFGADLIVCDESCLIEEESFEKITRMLADSPDSVLVLLANPWHRRNYYYRAWTDGHFHNIHVPWQVGVEEGRITKEFVEEQRRLISKQAFQVLWDSDFPDEGDDTLIKFSWIEKAVKNDFTWRPDEIYFGVDVARYGEDKTVIMVVGKHVTEKGVEQWKIIRCYDYEKQSTVATAAQIMRLARKYEPERIYVDDTGIGGGVTDNLLGNSDVRRAVVPVVANNRSMMSDKDKDRFNNISSRNGSVLADIFEAGNIDIPDNKHLRRELNQPIFDVSTGKTKVDKNPEDVKSPDFFDALSLACSECDRKNRLAYSFINRKD